MDQQLKVHLTSRDLWMRVPYMILFAITYSIAELLVVCVTLFQFVTVLFTGSANRPMLEFGTNLAAYVYEVFEYQTFNTEDKPFPFAPWPDEEPGGEQWLTDEVDEDEFEEAPIPDDPTLTEPEIPLEPDGQDPGPAGTQGRPGEDDSSKA